MTDRKEVRYWASEKGVRLREYLVQFARARGLDPFVPETWYSLSRNAFSPEQVPGFLTYTIILLFSSLARFLCLTMEITCKL